MKSFFAVFCFLTIASTSNAQDAKVEKINHNRTISTSSALTTGTLKGSILPKMRVKVTNLFKDTFGCEGVQVNTALKEGLYFHDIQLTVQATCPTASLVDFGADFSIGLTRGAFNPKSLAMAINSIDKSGKSTSHIMNLTFLDQ